MYIIGACTTKGRYSVQGNPCNVRTYSRDFGNAFKKIVVDMHVKSVKHGKNCFRQLLGKVCVALCLLAKESLKCSKF